MISHPQAPRGDIPASQQGTIGIVVRPYGSRNWAVYEDGELLCVTVYKKGAVAVAKRIGVLTEAPPLPAATPETPYTPRKFRSARKGTDEAKETHQNA
ncbi:MAG: hypothetical protein ACI8XO_002668 [Verrucomicrobiales bacterium]|mgnify:CR=1 FL=1